MAATNRGRVIGNQQSSERLVEDITYSLAQKTQRAFYKAFITLVGRLTVKVSTVLECEFLNEPRYLLGSPEYYDIASAEDNENKIIAPSSNHCSNLTIKVYRLHTVSRFASDMFKILLSNNLYPREGWFLSTLIAYPPQYWFHTAMLTARANPSRHSRLLFRDHFATSRKLPALVDLTAGIIYRMSPSITHSCGTLESCTLSCTESESWNSLFAATILGWIMSGRERLLHAIYK